MNRIARHLRSGLVGLGLFAMATAAAAQTVQLPTFQQFSLGTTVVVPDRGSVSLGGVKRIASGQSQFGGLPGNRASSTAAQASGASISVQIHDFEAMDEALLRKAAAMRARAGGASTIKRQAVQPGHSAAALSLAEIRRQQTAGAASPAREAQQYLARAEAARAAGKPGLAKVYYQMAARRGLPMQRETPARDRQTTLSASSSSP